MKTVTGNQIDYLLNLLVKEEMANIDIEELSQQLRSAFAAERKKIAKDNWIKSVYGNIFLKIQGTKNIEELTNILVTELVLATGSQLGSFYLHENQCLKSVAVYGMLNHNEVKIFTQSPNLVNRAISPQHQIQSSSSPFSKHLSQTHLVQNPQSTLHRISSPQCRSPVRVNELKQPRRQV
jgi:hypothetical protein